MQQGEPYHEQIAAWGERIRQASVPDRKNLPADLIAGLTTAISAIPDNMASAVMATLNPVQGLYAGMIGTPVAALTTGSVFMLVNTTSAMALATGDALAGLPEEQKLPAVVTLTILIGVFQLVCGLAKLGFLTRYVSNAVMTGFLTGIAIIIVLSQLPDLTGLDFTVTNKVLRLAELALRLAEVDLPTVAVAAGTIGLVLAFDRTRLRTFSMLLALILVSMAVPFMGWSSVALVGTDNDIPRALPEFFGFSLVQFPGLLVSAVAIGIIGMVQGAGIGQSYPNPGGRSADPSRDFVGQGIANMASGAFLGMPVGGSAGATSLNVGAGARTRWANIFSGVFLLVAIIAFGGLVERIPMAALASLLVLAGISAINIPRIATVLQTGTVGTVVMAITFGATLMLPVQQAVFLGVAVSFLMIVVSSSEKVSVVEIVPHGNELPEEREAPAELPGGRITILQPYGSLFFAGARTLEESLPTADGARRAVVILLLRGYPDVGSTFIGVLRRYAQTLQLNGGRLMLTGVSTTAYRQLEKTGLVDLLGQENVFPAGPRLFEPTLRAYRTASAWLTEPVQDAPHAAATGNSAAGGTP